MVIVVFSLQNFRSGVKLRLKEGLAVGPGDILRLSSFKLRGWERKASMAGILREASGMGLFCESRKLCQGLKCIGNMPVCGASQVVHEKAGGFFLSSSSKFLGCHLNELPAPPPKPYSHTWQTQTQHVTCLLR